MGTIIYSTGVDKISVGGDGNIYNSGRLNVYLCDEESDLPSTDIQPGFLAIVWDTGGFYIANQSLQWERKDVAETAWPIGSVFFLIPDTNPSELLGFGTWVEVQQDKLPVHVWRRTA